MILISYIVIPVVIFFIIIYGLFKKVNIYDSFLSGCKDGIKIVINIFPAMLAMVFAVNLFFDSNVLSFLFLPIKNFINIPVELLSMAFLRPISGNATLTIMSSVFDKYGPDSFNGIMASVIQGCTDTTIYVIALYYSSVRITKTRYTIIVGLLADLVGILMAFILTNIFF